MKSLVVCTLSLCCAVGLLAQAPAKNPPAKPGASGGTKAAAPAKDAKGAKKKEEPAKIEGMEISRGEKGYLGLQIAGGAFQLSFYDKDKKPVPPDVARAAVRWDAKYKVGDERLILNREGNVLTNPKAIRPPYVFKLFITLIQDAAEGQAPVNETLVVDFRQ